MVDENDIIIGQISHIEGEKPGSARYNPNMSEEQRKDYDNLILLCPTHHEIIDKDQTTYTTDKLKKIKGDLKNKYPSNEYNVSPDVLRMVNVSINSDEYSLARIHNMLKIYKKTRRKRN